MLNCLNRFEGDAIYLIDGEFISMEVSWSADPKAPGHYWCDETRADVCGPYASLKAAEAALQKYCEECL